ncbi:MAG: hypothetical protein ACHQVS_00690 [Candidatus Babeliales bacterium]
MIFPRCEVCSSPILVYAYDYDAQKITDKCRCMCMWACPLNGLCPTNKIPLHDERLSKMLKPHEKSIDAAISELQRILEKLKNTEAEVCIDMKTGEITVWKDV